MCSGAQFPDTGFSAMVPIEPSDGSVKAAYDGWVWGLVIFIIYLRTSATETLILQYRVILHSLAW